MASASSNGFQSQISSVLPRSADQEAFEAQLATAMSFISSNRAAVEAAFHRLIDTHPDLLALHFAAPLSLPSTPADSRGMQAAILRQLLSRGSQAQLWSRLSDTAKDKVKTCVLSGLKSAPDSRDIWDVVTELAARLLPDPGSRWDDLILYLIDAGSSQSPTLQVSSLLVFAEVNIAQAFDDYSSCVMELLEHCLQHNTSPDVRIAALAASCNIVDSLAMNSAREKMQYLLPLMVNALTDLSKPANEAFASCALKLLLKISCTHASFLEPQIDQFAAGMLQVAEGNQANCSTKTIAVEFLVNAAERAGIFLRIERARGTSLQLPNLVDRVAHLLMTMLLHVEDNTVWKIAANRDGSTAEVNGCFLAQLGLHRLANAYGDDFAAIAIKLLQEYFSAPMLEWKKHCAALIALAQIAKGCAKVMLQNSDRMVAIILKEFKHPHPSVQWAAINAISQLSIDLGPNLQDQYHRLVVPALVNALGDSHFPLIQEHAAATILIFSKNCSNGVMAQHMNTICSKLNAFSKAKQVAAAAPEANIEVVPPPSPAASDSVATPLASPPSAEANIEVVPAAQRSSAKRGFKIRRGLRTKPPEPAKPKEPDDPKEPVNEQQKMRPIRGNALAGFLKGLSTAAVTITATIVITVATVAWPENPTTISKMVLAGMIYYSLPMTAVASALAHASEHDDRWHSIAALMLMAEVLLTILLGGGVIAFKHECQLAGFALTLMSLVIFLIGWNFVIKQPECLRKVMDWLYDQLPAPQAISQTMRGFFPWIKQRFTRSPVGNSGLPV